MMNLTPASAGSNAKTTRIGLLALAVTFSAGIHAALVPEHLEELPPLGYAFIVAAVIGGVLALGSRRRSGTPRPVFEEA